MNPISSSASRRPAATAIVRYPARSSASSSFSDAGVIGATVATTAGAPLTTRISCPASTAIASAILTAGSNGVKRTTVSEARPRPLAAIVLMTESIGSWPSGELASAAKLRTSASSQPGFIGRIALTTNSFWVSVPVLSQQTTSTMAASFSEDSRVSRTPLNASVFAPNALALSPPCAVDDRVAPHADLRDLDHVARLHEQRRRTLGCRHRPAFR